MNGSADSPSGERARHGETTAAGGTPFAVPVSGDRRDRSLLAILLVGPVIWFGHFMLVYVVAEMGCTGSGPGFRLFDPPVPVLTTLLATVAAVALCAASTAWGLRVWRASRRRAAADDDVDDALSREHDGEQRGGSLAFMGAMLSAFSLVAVVFTAAPALVLWSC